MDGSTRQPMELILRSPAGVDRTLRKHSSPRVDTGRCINCGICIEACPTGAVHELQRQICRLCPDCAKSPVMFPRDMVEMTSRSCAAACPLGHYP